MHPMLSHILPRWAVNNLAARFLIGSVIVISFVGVPPVRSIAQSSKPSPIGINLSGISYYSPEQPFLNIFKTASLWITGSYKNGQWDTGEQSKLALDVNGWPTSVTVGSGGQAVTYDNVGVLLQRSFGAPYYPGGRYVVLYKAPASFSIRLMP
jgi:hypothetical protein